MKIVWTILATLVLSLIAYTSRVRVTENFHEVDPGRFYRSAQLTPEELSEKIEAYGIKTVISLRGAPQQAYWYQPEVELLHRKGVVFKAYGLDVDTFPTKEQLTGLLDDFDHAPKPILIHCRSGADRTGMVSALYAFDKMGQSREDALRQLAFKYWHVELFHPAMDDFIRAYDGREWARDYQRCVYPRYANGESCGT